MPESSTATTAPGRVGHGWDRHRLEPLPPAGAGRRLVVGGRTLESAVGPAAHSDGDALAHAVTDALLGAAGLGDIGTLFPDSDPAYEGADSLGLLAAAARRVREAGWRVVNVDATVLLEAPKLGDAKGEIRANLARALGVSAGVISVKGKTGEGIGAVGRGEAIEAHAVALLEPAVKQPGAGAP